MKNDIKKVCKRRGRVEETVGVLTGDSLCVKLFCLRTFFSTHKQSKAVPIFQQPYLGDVPTEEELRTVVRYAVGDCNELHH